MRAAIRGGFLLALCLLASCGGGRSPYGGTARPTGVKLGKPYTINGQLYEPKYDPSYVEIGMASWYGPGFNGRMTASGERYDMNDLTAAHRTLPMPALVRVTALANGHSIIVRVNDRGPFKKDRLIDLSSGAADALGMKPVGTVKVRVEYLPEATDKYLADIGISKPDWMTAPNADSPHTLEAQYATIAAETGVGIHPASGYLAPMPVKPAPLAPFATASIEPATSIAAPVARVSVEDSPFDDRTPAVSTDSPFAPQGSAPIPTGSIPVVSAEPAAVGNGHYFVQTASFGSEANAKAHAAKIASLGPVETKQTTVNGKLFYRVVIGPESQSGQAQQILERAKGMGFTDARILVQ